VVHFYVALLVYFSLTLDTFVVWNAMGRDSILFQVDIYVGMAMLLPHIEIVEITYLIIKEKFYRLYYKVVNLIRTILSPLFWSYDKTQQAYYFFKSKSDERKYRQEQQKYEEQSKQHFEQEQQRRNKEYEYQQNEQEKRYKKQEQEQREKRYKQKQEDTEENESVYEDEFKQFFSNSYYEVLGVSKNDNFDTIKKKYRALVFQYHPDKNNEEQEKYTEIMQKINKAYDFFEKLHKK